MQESAFPVNTANISNPGAFGAEPGMTLRDWFAGQALVGMLTREEAGNADKDMVACQAYYYADAMLAARAALPGGCE